MTYKIKRKTPLERELKVFKEKTKGKPNIREIAREGSRVIAHVPERTHKKGSVVEYKGSYAKVTKVTKKGVFIKPYKEDKKTGFLKESENKVFVSDDQIHEGKIYPLYVFTLT